MGLVTFAFNTSIYFQYNGKVYKRLHGIALASQVFVVVIAIVAGTLIQNTKKRATISLFPHLTLPCEERWLYNLQVFNNNNNNIDSIFTTFKRPL